MYRKNKKRLAANKYLRICSGIAAFVGLAFLYTHKQMYLLDAFACGVILLGSMIFFDGRHFPKAVPVLGGLSYAFYLVHYYVILILSKFFNLTGWTAAAVTLLAIVLSYVAAWCANQLIERKFTNWLERKIFMQD